MATAVDIYRENIGRLCVQFDAKELYVFGSAAEGGFKAGKSDYDFLVRFLPCSPSEHADRYFGLLEGFEDLLHASVDLVEIDAVTNTYFRRRIEQSRVPIYAS